MSVEKIIEKAIEAGGKRWTKGDLDRVYINPQTIGYEFSYYKTGNICDAKDPDGDTISNAEGRRVKSYKAWIDCKDGSAHTRANSMDFEGFFEEWFDELTKEVEKEEETMPSKEKGFVLIDCAVALTSEEMRALEENYTGENLENELKRATVSREYKEEIRTEMRFTEKPIVKPVFTMEQKENGEWLIRLTGCIARVEDFMDECFGGDLALEYYTDFEY